MMVFSAIFGILVNMRAGHLLSQLFVPSNLRHEILTNVHNDGTGGHLRIHKTYEKLRRKYY